MSRIVNTENLPHKGDRFIDWLNSVGYTCSFEYDDKIGEFTIKLYCRDGKKVYIDIDYNDRIIHINTQAVKNGKIGSIFNSKTKYYGRVVEGKNDIPTVASWMVLYFQGGVEEAKQYAPNSTKKLIFKCPICGRLTTKPISICHVYKRHSIGCVCNPRSSFPEFIMDYLLKLSGYKYYKEIGASQFDWCEGRRYDFYIPELKCIIETHGQLHYRDSTDFDMTLEELLKIDRHKKELALQNGIEKYYEINCSNPSFKSIINESDKVGILELLNLNKDNIKLPNDRNETIQNDINKCKLAIENNPYMTPNDFRQLLGDLEMDKGKLRRLLAKANIYPIIKHYVNVYKNGELYLEFSTIESFRNQSREKIGKHVESCLLIDYINHNTIINNCYTFKSNIKYYYEYIKN